MTKLAGMGPQFEVPSADSNMHQVHNTLRGTIRYQGELVSKTLSNNALLWEERKQLRSIIVDLRAELTQLSSELETTKTELAKLSTPEHRSFHELRLENDALKAQLAGMRKALELHLVDAIDPSELKERVAALEAQRKELVADGAKPSELMRLQDARAKAAEQGREIGAKQVWEEAGVPPVKNPA